MAARTVEITQSDWADALREFSAIHQGWLMSLDILSPGNGGARAEITDLPLIGTSFDAPDGDTMRVVAGRSAADYISHPIPAPRRLWMERTPAGADAALRVESADGSRTILRLKTAALPETVDGIVRP